MWLDDLLSNITSTGDDSASGSVKMAKLCTTRRSAGVPFIVQALITTELEVRVKPECFHKTVATLLVLAKESGSDGQLHALNILRALFRSAHLGEHVASYVSEGFVVSINAFKSSNWAVC
jgi:thyroid adenoma-associated protein